MENFDAKLNFWIKQVIRLTVLELIVSDLYTDTEIGTGT